MPRYSKKYAGIGEMGFLDYCKENGLRFVREHPSEFLDLTLHRLGILAAVSRRLARASFRFHATPARVAALRCRSPRLSRSLLFRLSRRKIPPRHRARTSSALRLFRIRSLERNSRARAPQSATSHALTFFPPRT